MSSNTNQSIINCFVIDVLFFSVSTYMLLIYLHIFQLNFLLKDVPKLCAFNCSQVVYLQVLSSYLSTDVLDTVIYLQGCCVSLFVSDVLSHRFQ